MSELEQMTIPWNGRPGQRLLNARRVLLELVGFDAEDLLPSSIEVVTDEMVNKSFLKNFVQSTAAQLGREIPVWRRRLGELAGLGLMSASEIGRITKLLKAAQPWFIYASRTSGLIGEEEVSETAGCMLGSSGVIPCSAAPHHGVGWWTDQGVHRSVLITSHRENGSWNWDEDIGHEAAHAAFGPVPLFSQHYEEAGANRRLVAPNSKSVPLAEEAIARVCYLVSEIVVVFLRGEQRFTGTGLPGLNDHDELSAFLRIADRLLPGARFGDVLPLIAIEGLPLPIWSGQAIRHLGASALYFAGHSASLANSPEPPAESWFHAP